MVSIKRETTEKSPQLRRTMVVGRWFGAPVVVGDALVADAAVGDVNLEFGIEIYEVQESESCLLFACC